MNTTPTRTLALTTAALLLAAAASFAAQPKGEGWISLFNGKNLDGWQIPEGDNGHWKVVDGAIDYGAGSEATGNRSLYTEQEFENFVLKIDWRFKDYSGLYPIPTVLPDGSEKTDENGKVITEMKLNADSGILFREGVQSNLWCWPIGSGEIWSYRRDKTMPAEVRAGATPNVHADNPVGEWNKMTVRLKGEHVTITLNGKKVIDKALLPGLAKKSTIGLQHHGGRNADGTPKPASSLIQFRSIYLKKLD